MEDFVGRICRELGFRNALLSRSAFGPLEPFKYPLEPLKYEGQNDQK